MVLDVSQISLRYCKPLRRLWGLILERERKRPAARNNSDHGVEQISLGEQVLDLERLEPGQHPQGTRRRSVRQRRNALLQTVAQIADVEVDLIEIAISVVLDATEAAGDER